MVTNEFINDIRTNLLFRLCTGAMKSPSVRQYVQGVYIYESLGQEYAGSCENSQRYTMQNYEVYMAGDLTTVRDHGPLMIYCRRKKVMLLTGCIHVL